MWLLMLSTSSNLYVAPIYLHCYPLKIGETTVKLYGSLSEGSQMCLLMLSTLSTEDSNLCSTSLLTLLSTEDIRENCEAVWLCVCLLML